MWLKPPLRNKVDADGATHTFRAHASAHFYGLAFIVGAVVCAVAALGDGSLGQSAGLIAMAFALGWLARRALSLKVVVTRDGLVAANWFRTWHASSADVRAIDLRLISEATPAAEWVPSVELLTGRHFVLRALAQSDWRKTPATFAEMLASTNEIRRVLGVGGTD